MVKEYKPLTNKEYRDYLNMMKGRWEEDKKAHKHRMTFKEWLLRGIHYINHALLQQAMIAEYYKERSENPNGIVAPSGKDLLTYGKKDLN